MEAVKNLLLSHLNEYFITITIDHLVEVRKIRYNNVFIKDFNNNNFCNWL